MEAAAWVGLAVLAAVTLACLAGGLWWGFELFTHFRLQYLALSLAVIVAALWLGRQPLAVAAMLLGLPHLLIVGMGLRLAAPAVAASGDGFSLTTINLLFSNRQHERVFSLIAEKLPDVLVLQEADRGWIGKLDGVALLYPHAAPANWRQGQDVVIFSRLPISQWSAASPRVVAATVETAAGPVRVIGVHARVPASAAEARLRAEDYAEIVRLNRATAMPTVAAGDFNSTVWSPDFRAMGHAAGLSGQPTGATWKPAGLWPLSLPIDHVLTGHGLTTASLERGPDVGSDHRPLIARLRPAQ